jgi:hypothetical protein
MSVKSQDELVNKIKTELNRNELIHDTTHVSIQVKSSGSIFKKQTVLQITGRVDQEREKEEIEKTVAANAGKMEVVSTLRVESR